MTERGLVIAFAPPSLQLLANASLSLASPCFLPLRPYHATVPLTSFPNASIGNGGNRALALPSSFPNASIGTGVIAPLLLPRLFRMPQSEIQRLQVKPFKACHRLNSESLDPRWRHSRMTERGLVLAFCPSALTTVSPSLYYRFTAIACRCFTIF